MDKTSAGWWAAGQISDSEFAASLQYLIKKDIITIPNNPTTQTLSSSIPDWLRNSVQWWAAGQINDSEFLQGVQWMIKNGIIEI